MPAEFKGLLSANQLAALDAINTLQTNPNDTEALLKMANVYFDANETAAQTDAGAAIGYGQQGIRYAAQRACPDCIPPIVVQRSASTPRSGMVLRSLIVDTVASSSCARKRPSSRVPDETEQIPCRPDPGQLSVADRSAPGRVLHIERALPGPPRLSVRPARASFCRSRSPSLAAVGWSTPSAAYPAVQPAVPLAVARPVRSSGGARQQGDRPCSEQLF